MKGHTKMNAELKLGRLTASEIAKATGGKLIKYGSGCIGEIGRISTNSKEVGADTAFFALIGEKFDAHDFISDAVDGGASVIVATHIPKEVAGNFDAVIVPDTLAALGALAGYYRGFTKAKVIAVTGSVGKTTTKEFIYSVCSAAHVTHKTYGNYNNEIGLPFTLFDTPEDAEIIVVELGMRNLGELTVLSQIAKPDMAVITNIGTSHLANLGTRENICTAKMEITAGMKPDGILLINGDEPLLLERREQCGVNTMCMSIQNRTSEFRATNIRTAGRGMMFDLICDGDAVINVDIPALGRHNVYNALAAFSIGSLLGMSEDQIRGGLMNFVATDKRLTIYEIGGVRIIDDCYNASPESMRAGLDVLCAEASKSGETPAALLGDMLELGEYSRLMHDQLGQYAAQAKLQKLFCYGSMADIIAEAAIKKGIRADNVYVCAEKNPKRMAEMLMEGLCDGDILLVKASRGMALEEVIDLYKKASKKKPSK